MRQIIVFIALFFTIANLYGQGYYNHWYFGNGASIDFNSGAPVATNNGAMQTAEGCASISDYNGNLLFYSDGSTVYNRNHAIMLNGTNLRGDWSSSQSALIVRVPNDTMKYYLFTQDDHLSAGDLHYSIVDMTLDGGNGAVINKNTFLGTTFTEKLVAAHTNCGVWVLSHKKGNSDFYAFFVDDTGVSAPVISSAGATHTGWTGVMKVSPNNKKIAIATLARHVELLDFDQYTGVVSGGILLPVLTPEQPWGVCFSPNSLRLYAGEGSSPASVNNKVYQYDISSGVPATIIASKTLVGFPSTPGIIVFDMQIGPDDKIYVARNLTQYLDVIVKPDNVGGLCKYVSNGMDLVNAFGRIGLPNAVKFPGPNYIADKGICAGANVSIDVTVPNGTYDWSPKDGTVSCVTCPVVTITPNTTTVYTVGITSAQGCFGETSFEIKVSDMACSSTVIQDVTVVGGDDGIASASGTNGFPDYGYIWSDGQTTQVATGLSAGNYTVTVYDDIGCEKVCNVDILDPSGCEPCAEAEVNETDICVAIDNDANHPLATLDCDEGGIMNSIECMHGGDPLDPEDDCSMAIVSGTDLCLLINSDPDHPLADKDCDDGGIPNLLECKNSGNPAEASDECAVAKSGALNVCEFINYKSGHPMAVLDCDTGGVNNYIECINGLNACDITDDCTAAVRGSLDVCAMINNDPNHPWASLDCDEGGIINITECLNGANPSKPSDDLNCPPNLCAEAIVGNIDICTEVDNDPNHPIGPLDCDGDGVTNADECRDNTDPLDPCDFEPTSITLTVTADQSGCPIPCPDLTPIMTILPGNIAGMSSVEAAVQITELDSVDTNGSIVVVRIPSDPRLVFVWNIGLTMSALVPVQNADWNYLGDNGFVHTFTYNGPGLVIPAEGTAAFGFQSFYDPQSTDGQTTLTATIIPFSGGECNALNNTDSERLVYFE